MAKPDSEQEIERILRNMEKMGWPVRQVNGSSYIVQVPGGGSATINARAGGHGHGRNNLLRTIRETGYFELWEAWQEEDRAKRLEGSRQPNINVNHDSQLLIPQQLAQSPISPTEPLEVPVTSPSDSGKLPVGERGPTDRTQVDGVKIVGRGPAKYDAANAAVAAGEVVRGVEEILLEDERVLYQCVRSTRCFRVFETVRSATAHLRAHGSAQSAKRADERHANYSAGARAGYAARMERLTQLADPDVRRELLTDFGDITEGLVQLLRDLVKLPEPGLSPEETLRLGALLDTQQARIAELEAEVARLTAELAGRVQVTPEELAALREQAENYRVIQKALGR